MTVFHVPSQCEVSARAVNTVIKAIQIDFLKKKLLKKHHLNDIDESSWIPAQRFMALLEDINAEMPVMLRTIGEHIYSTMKFPTDIDNFDKALKAIEPAYKMAHRGSNEIGHYMVERVSETEYLLHCDNPYPCPFDQGLLLGIATQFKTKISLTHDDQKCRMQGDAHCLYRITIV